MTEDSQFQSREENGSRLHIIPLIFPYILALIFLTLIYFLSVSIYFKDA